MSETTLLKTFKGTEIYQTLGEPSGIIFLAGMAIDADGAPNAYGPEGTDALDYLANAGSPGDWWGIACDSSGEPYVQKVYHPYPGYYVSTTSLQNSQFPPENPDSNLNSVEIPFIVLPTTDSFGCEIGDLGLVYNLETGDNMYVIVGDLGPMWVKRPFVQRSAPGSRTAIRRKAARTRALFTWCGRKVAKAGSRWISGLRKPTRS